MVGAFSLLIFQRRIIQLHVGKLLHVRLGLRQFVHVD